MIILGYGPNRPRSAPLILTALLGAAFACADASRPAARAEEGPRSGSEATWRLVDDFEGVQSSWHIPPQESLRGVLARRRTDQSSRQGLRCEYLAVLAEKGDERIFATHPLPPSMAIREFQASLWLRGNRPGFQLMARVRLPRTLDDKTGEPLSLLVEGDAYAAVGNWQRLSLSHVDQAVADKTRALRAERGPHVDPGEAYVDLIVLNLYGGAGINRLWVDDLMLTGAVPCPRFATQQVREASFQASPSAPQVQVRRDVLLIEGDAFMPRIHEFQGESFDLLQKVGFNCVWLPQPASDRQNAMARRHNLWLLCPAPDPPHDLKDFDRVLAWCVGRNVTARDTANIEKLSRAVRSRDIPSRPLMLSAGEHHDVWSRYVEIVVDIGPVVAKRPLGYPLWRPVPLTSFNRPGSWPWVRDQAHRAIAAGYQGLVLASQENLEQPGSWRQRRLVELLNLECEALQPWAVAHHADASQVVSATAPHPVTVLRKGHIRLALVPLDATRYRRPAAALFSSVTIPTACTHAAFLMETDRISPLTTRHLAGGVSVMLPAALTSAKIVFTDQATVIRRLTQHLRKTAPRTKELLLDVARAEILELDRRISHVSPGNGDQAALRRRMHRLHGLLPPSARATEHGVTGRHLERVFSELEEIRRTLPASSPAPPQHGS